MRNNIKVLGVVCVALFLGGCPHKVVLTAPPLAKPLADAGYIVLPIADSDMRPGSVIEVKQDANHHTHVRWLADIRSCGLTDKDLGFRQGTTGAIEANKKYSLDASAALAILSIDAKVSPKLQAASSATLKADNVGSDKIDMIKMMTWFDPGHIAAMPQVCKTYLSQPDIYLVNEAFRVSSGSYTFADSAGVNIDLSGLTGQTISANAAVSVGRDGSITFSSVEYLAVKDVKQAGLGVFATQGNTAGAQIPSADGLLTAQSLSVDLK